jgi:hypothetical protein
MNERCYVCGGVAEAERLLGLIRKHDQECPDECFPILWEDDDEQSDTPVPESGIRPNKDGTCSRSCFRHTRYGPGSVYCTLVKREVWNRAYDNVKRPSEICPIAYSLLLNVARASDAWIDDAFSPGERYDVDDCGCGGTCGLHLTVAALDAAQEAGLLEE